MLKVIALFISIYLLGLVLTAKAILYIFVKHCKHLADAKKSITH